MTTVTFVFTITLWMRLVGAIASGWLADRIGRKTPLMISILGYSLCNFIAGFSPTSCSCFRPRAARHLHGGGMAGRRGAGDGELADPLARLHERRAAGLVGPRLPAVVRRLRPVLSIRSAGAACCWSACCRPWRSFYVRYYVKEPEVWVENRRLQRAQNREVRAPLFSIFKRGMLGNTLTPAGGWRALRCLLLDHRAVRDPTAGRPEIVAGGNRRGRRRGRSWGPSSPASFWGVLADKIGRRAGR